MEIELHSVTPTSTVILLQHVNIYVLQDCSYNDRKELGFLRLLQTDSLTRTYEVCSESRRTARAQPLSKSCDVRMKIGMVS